MSSQEFDNTPPLVHPDLLHSQWYFCIQFTSAHSDQFTDTHAVSTQSLNCSVFLMHRQDFHRKERRLHPSSSHLGHTSEEMLGHSDSSFFVEVPIAVGWF